jgi:hypothetical protein
MTKHGMVSHHIAQKEEAENGTIMESVFWDSEGYKLVKFLEKKGKISMQLATFRRSTNFAMRFMNNVRRRKLSSFNMTT